jgi:uncharacterized protein YycO
MNDVSAPPISIRWFPENLACTDAEPGDMLLLKKAGLIPRAIRVGEWLRRTDRAYAWANHAAVFLDAETIAEAGPHGIALTAIADYQHLLYAVVHPDATDDQIGVTLDFVEAKLGVKYGFLTILAEAFNSLFHTRVVIGDGDRLICSAFACEAWMPVGLIADVAPEICMPADLARFFDARYTTKGTP